MEDDWTNRGIRVDRQWSKQTIDAGLPSKAYYILMFFFFPNFYWRRCTFPGSCRAYEHFHVPKLILQKDIFNQDQVKKWKIIREMIEKDGRGREGQICMTVKLRIVKWCPELLDNSSFSRRTTWTFLIEHKLQSLYVFKVNIESSINLVLNSGFLNFCLKKGDESRYLKRTKKVC